MNTTNSFNTTPPPARGNSIIVADPSPYPTVRVDGKCLRYANILSNDFASSKGEISGILQYLYEHWVLECHHPEISTTIKSIARVEMHHFDILGELIVKLGGNPKLLACRPDRQTIWNGNMIYYTDKLKQLLRFNIMAERSAIENYSLHIKCIGDENIKVILQRIILDEKIHLKIFEEMLTSQCK